MSDDDNPRWVFPVAYLDTAITPKNPYADFSTDTLTCPQYLRATLDPKNSFFIPLFIGPLRVEHWDIPLEYAHEVESLLLLGISPLAFALENFPHAHKVGLYAND